MSPWKPDMACWPTFLLRQYFLPGIVYFTRCVFKNQRLDLQEVYHFLYSVRKSSRRLDPNLLKHDFKVETFWNYSHRFSQGSKDKFNTIRSVKHGGKSWFRRQVWSHIMVASVRIRRVSQWLYDNVKHRPTNPCETIKPFPLENCGISNVKIIWFF